MHGTGDPKDLIQKPAVQGSRRARLGQFAGQAVLPALILLATYLVTAELLKGPDRDGLGNPRAETVFSVTAVDVEVADQRATLRAFGEVVAAESAELRVASPGEVVALNESLQVGKTVEEGAALVTIDPFIYEGALRDARAQLAEARARMLEAEARISMESSMVARSQEQLTFAEIDLSRAERLANSGTITDRALDDRRLIVSQRKQAYDQRRYTLEAEEARLEQQAAAVERLQWQVERSQRALEDTVLEAPFRGIVRSENVALGRLLAANDVAVSLIRADALDVRFVLSDQRYGRLLSGESLFGTTVEVIWRIGDTPIAYDAVVTRAGADIESDRGGVDVFARLNLQDRPALRPGAFVEVRIPGVIHGDSVRVPTASLYDGKVFVIGADERLVSKPVAVLALDDGDVIVRGDFETGDSVVTTRLAEAGDGIRVRRVDPSEGAERVIDGPADDGPAAAEAPERTAEESTSERAAQESTSERAAEESNLERAAEESALERAGANRRSRRRRGDGVPAERS